MMKPAAPNFRSWFWTLALLGGLADQATKYAAYAWVEPGTERIAFSSPLTLTIAPLPYNHLNTGALGGIGKQLGPSSNWVLAGVCVLAIVIIAIWSRRTAFTTSRFTCIAVGLLLAGAAGNLYDRVVFHGVRDFLQLHADAEREIPLTYIFNLADFWLICGAGMLLLHALFAKAEEKPAGAPEAAASEPAAAANPEAAVPAQTASQGIRC